RSGRMNDQSDISVYGILSLPRIWAIGGSANYTQYGSRIRGYFEGKRRSRRFHGSRASTIVPIQTSNAEIILSRQMRPHFRKAASQEAYAGEDELLLERWPRPAPRLTCNDYANGHC